MRLGLVFFFFWRGSLLTSQCLNQCKQYHLLTIYCRSERIVPKLVGDGALGSNSSSESPV